MSGKILMTFGPAPGMFTILIERLPGVNYYCRAADLSDPGFSHEVLPRRDYPSAKGSSSNHHTWPDFNVR